MFRIELFTDETVALVESFPYLILISERDARWPPKIAVQKASVTLHKPINIYYIRFISRRYCTLIVFRVASLAWIITSMRLGREEYKSFTIFTNMRCHPPWLIAYNSSRLRDFLQRSLLFSSVHICSNWPIIQYGSTFITQILFCCKQCVAWSIVMLKNITFIQTLYQIVLQQLNVFGTIRVSVNFN